MKNLKYFWIASVVVVAMWLFSAFGYPWLFEEIKLEDLAQKGDSFGAINALFSGLAFAGLIYTMIMQRQELEMQRKELAAQRKEMRESRGELEEQNRIQAEQVALRKKELMLNEVEVRLACLEHLMEFSKMRAELADSEEKRNEYLTEFRELAEQYHQFHMELIDEYDKFKTP
jgi:hypothetical protein